MTSLVISSSPSSVELTRYICELADPAKPVFAGENKAHHTTGNSAHLHLKNYFGGFLSLKTVVESPLQNYFSVSLPVRIKSKADF